MNFPPHFPMPRKNLAIYIGASLALGLATLAGCVQEPENSLPPFTIDHKSRVDSAADVSFLLQAPAGKTGFIRVENGHLVKPGGERFRIWGVNLTGWGEGSNNIPPKDQAALWAAELARFGINCVRFHFLDLTTDHHPAGAKRHMPAGLIEADRSDTLEFDKEQLDKLDNFIAELKKRGIYINLNLNVGRTYKAEDRVADYDQIGNAKAMTYIDDRLLELQRDYAKKLLTHFNPYTKTEYRHEPAVAIVEMVNENSVFEFWDRNWLRGERTKDGPRYQLDLTPTYEKLLTAKFNLWLAEHKTAEELAELRTLAGVKSGEAIPRLHREQFSEAPEKRFYAEAEFYADLEDSFFQNMKKYLKEELGVESLIVGTADHTYWIPNQPLVRGTSKMDIVDGHVYWQHPAIWGARNTPMVNDPLHSTIVKLSRSPVAGKPFTVSEVNHPNPNEYGCEMIPILAAYAGFQDWDGVFFYTLELKTDDDAQTFVADNFDISQDPVKMVQMAAGALLFLRGDVLPAKETVVRNYSTKQVWETMRLPEAERPYFTPGFPLSLPLRHGSRIGCFDCDPTVEFEKDKVNPENDSIVSDTKQLTWNISPEHSGLVTIDTDRTQALVGFVKANHKTTKHLSAEVKNDFCAITLSSLDAAPISRAKTLLLTTGSRIENTGTQWNDRHTLWSEWGTGPTRIDPVRGWLTLRELDGAVAVLLQPLDGAAKPIGKPISGRRLEDGWELPLGEPATTFYLIKVVR
jgi:hypothetical protein